MGEIVINRFSILSKGASKCASTVRAVDRAGSTLQSGEHEVTLKKTVILGYQAYQ
jgi:hypothetical protein